MENFRRSSVQLSQPLGENAENAGASVVASGSAARGGGQPRNADDIVRVLRDDGTLDPALDPKLPDTRVVELYREMVRVRAVDDRMVVLQRSGRIGFHIGSRGEEAAILGSAAALREKDWMFPCYRELGAALLRGMPLDAYVHQMFGDARDPAKGRQMPDHYFWREARVAAVSTPVGTQITHAVGFAWGAKIRHDHLAALVYFGEGATSSADFHNGLNFAGVFDVPVVFFCRNNGWAVSLPAERQTASATFAEKAVAYGIEGVRVDGRDLFAVAAVTRDAVARALAGEGPTLIEAVTTSEEGEQHDPIARTRRWLEGRGLWDAARENEWRELVARELDAAVNEAERTAPPAIETMFDDVYGALPTHLREQRDALLAGPRPGASAPAPSPDPRDDNL